MPRKKTKHQFRRGSEQRYHKLAAYTSRNTSSGIHLPIGWLVILMCIGAGVVSFSLFRTQLLTLLVHIPPISIGNLLNALSQLHMPDITWPTVSLPTVRLPAFSFDIAGIWTSILSYLTTIWTTFLSVFPVMQSALISVVTTLQKIILTGFSLINETIHSWVAFVVGIDTQPVAKAFYDGLVVLRAWSIAYLNPLIIVQTSLKWESLLAVTWWQTLFLLPGWLLSQYWVAHVVMSDWTLSVTAVLTAAFITGSVSLWAILSQFYLACAAFVMTIVHAIGAFFAAIATWVDGVGHAIAGKWQSIVKTVSPYVQFLVDTFKLCFSEFKTSIIVVSRVTRDVMAMYHENTSKFSH